MIIIIIIIIITIIITTILIISTTINTPSLFSPLGRTRMRQETTANT